MKLLDLPLDALRFLFEHLPRKDIKSLRLNIDVALHVASHPEFKLQVKEIVWDDARLEEYADPGVQSPLDDVDSEIYENPCLPTFDTFVKRAGDYESPKDGVDEDSVFELRKKELWDGKPLMQLPESFALYRSLYAEQQVITEREEDVEALRMVLRSLPNVTRFTLTSEAWRYYSLFPVYETPFFRSLPPGFRMPQPWPWLGDDSSHFRDYTAPETDMFYSPWSEPHPEWRGYGIAVRELLVARQHHRLTKFVIDVHREPTGISQQLFLAANEDLSNTIALYNAVPLTRLKLAINTAGIDLIGDDNFWKHTWLKKALSSTPALRYFHFHTTRIQDEIDDWMDPEVIPWMNLQDMFPTPHAEAWPHLRHLGLANLIPTEDSLYELISTLPSLQEVDLDSLVIGTNGEPVFFAPKALLARLKTHLVDPEGGAWRTRQPRWILRSHSLNTVRNTYDSDIIDRYMYQGGKDPFVPLNERPQEDQTAYTWDVDDFDEDSRVPMKIMSDEERAEYTNRSCRGLLLYGSAPNYLARPE